MKLRYVLIVAAAVAGFGASLALADNGHRGDRGKGDCKHGVVSGFASAPQSLTLTVSRANDQSGLKKGQVVTVAVGAQGQQVRVIAEGCVGTDGTLTVRGAVLQAGSPRSGKKDGRDGDHGGTTTSATSTDGTTSTQTDSTSTGTSTSSGL
jgi:hypothetical protein